MKKLVTLTFCLGLVLNLFAQNTQSDTETLILDKNYYGDYELWGYKYLKIPDSPKSCGISAHQMENGRKLSFTGDTLYIGRDITIYSEDYEPGSQYYKPALFPWTTEGSFNYVIYGEETTRSPRYDITQYRDGDYEIPFGHTSHSTLLFEKGLYGRDVIDLELRSREIAYDQYKEEPIDRTFNINRLIIEKSCKKIPGSYFRTPKEIIIMAETAPELTSKFYDDIYETCVLIVPAGKVPYYAGEKYWGLFKTIKDVNGSTDRGDETQYEFGDENYDDWWTKVPSGKVWTKYEDGSWLNYDYIYCGDHGIAFPYCSGFKYSDNPEFKNTILNINDDIEVNDEDASLCPFPIRGFIHLKEIVFGEKMKHYPCVGSRGGHGFGVTYDYYNAFPIKLFRDNNYTLRYNCSRLTSKYEEYSSSGSIITSNDDWSFFFTKLIIGEKCEEMSLQLPKVREIISEATTPPFIAGIFTPQQYSSVPVRVPAGCLETYKNDENWGKFRNMKEINSSDIIDVIPEAEEVLASIRIENGKIHLAEGISPDMPLEIYTADGILIYRGKDSVIDVPKGVIIVHCGGNTRKLIN